MPALSTTRPLVLVCLLTNELLSNLFFRSKRGKTVTLTPKRDCYGLRWAFSNALNCLCSLFSFGGIRYWQ